MVSIVPSDVIVEKNEELLDRAGDVRFIREIRAGDLEFEHFYIYLNNERRFVVNSSRLLASAMFSSPNEKALVEHTYAAYQLVHDQISFLDKALEHTERQLSNLPNESNVDHELSGIARRIARGGEYWKLMVLSYAAEHLYLTWCRNTLPYVCNSSLTGQWVAMHTTPEFENRVDYLASQINDVVSDEMLDQACQLFGSVLEAEILFHDAVYFSES